MGSDELYVAHRATIDRAVAVVSHRHHLSPQDAEEFVGQLRIHLIEDDYAVLRRFSHRSSMQTYLIVVVTHFFQDWRNARWGKWRPSAIARRLGPVAVHLETLTLRDGLSFDEARETLRTNHRVTESREQLEAMVVRFPKRLRRRLVSADVLEDQPANDPSPDMVLEDRERVLQARHATDMLVGIVAALPAQDRLILKMRFDDDCSVADIARALHLDQKPLYRRLERLLADLRKHLEESGLNQVQAAACFSACGFDRAADGPGRRRELSGDVRPFSGDRVASETARTP